MLEPIRKKWGNEDIPGEFQALKYFFKNCKKIGIDEKTKIRLRPHPSDPVGKYDEWIDRYGNYDIEIDSWTELSRSISWSSTVVGCESYALVVALSAGRRVISTLPPNAPTCALPMGGLLHLRELRDSNCIRDKS